MSPQLGGLARLAAESEDRYFYGPKGETQAPLETADRPSSAQHSNVSRRLRMDRAVPAMFPLNPYSRLGEPSASVVVDLRSPGELVAIDRLIPGSISRTSNNIEDWWWALPAGKPAVVFDGSGTPQSEEVATALLSHRFWRQGGPVCRYLQGSHPVAQCRCAFRISCKCFGGEN